MLNLSDVGMSFSGAAAIEALDLAVSPGEVVAVIGPSGCGKTTLLRIAAGLVQPSRGRVANAFARTGVVFQEARLAPWSDAVANAAFGLKALGVEKAERRRRARALLLQMGLSEQDLPKRPAALSGGMQQRVALARALAIEPQLLLMDEPFAALDAGLRRRMQDLVAQSVRQSGQTVVLVTHDVAEAVRVASRIVVLSPRPAGIVADAPNSPVDEPAAIYLAASELLRRAPVAAALYPPE
jgi:NitT/TauT family transport system ATP-binding protein